MRVAVVIPFRGGCAHRERAWRWVRERYESEEWLVVEAPAPPGPWAKAAAVNPAIEASAADIVVVADADVWCDGLRAAVAAVEDGAAWGMPHRLVHRLSEAGTAALVTGGQWEDHRPAQRPYQGVWGGGIVVGWRAVLLEAPLDPRFTSWGQEDQSWALALETLHGTGWRGDARLLHLFHEPQPRMTRQKGSAKGWALYLRYRQARNDPVAMAALLEEIRGH